MQNGAKRVFGLPPAPLSEGDAQSDAGFGSKICVRQASPVGATGIRQVVSTPASIGYANPDRLAP